MPPNPISSTLLKKLATYPQALPISAYAAELSDAIARNQVIIVCGDTGSGKTTQLPKIAQLVCAQTPGMVACTQPRRLAAISMAKRVAEELSVNLGDFVGYQHRFENRASQQTQIKFITDGILLAQTKRDPLLKKYAVLIIDEAHERSLNIDFILGLIKRILPKRPDLRVIISSATLDSAGFSAFFNQAPVLNIPGRLFPIDRTFAPLEDEDDDDLPRRVANAVDTLHSVSGDILVFLPGERDIRDTKEMLQGRHLPQTEIIPLLASLPTGEQERAFKLSSNRRIILATNVAETSLTIPGIRCVIDSGLARIKRYNPKTHIQQLKIEPISQASCRQRMGRCGRVGPGTCVCLYSEDDFNRREANSIPEIKRSALAGVILSMYDLKLGSIDDFPFIEPPSSAMIREGYRELIELNAISNGPQGWHVTPIGRALMDMPIEPRYARMILAAREEQAMRDTLTVVAGLACDDPRQRPVDKQDEADRIHRGFLTVNSDFTAMLNLWNWYHDPAQGSSQSAKRKRCKASFLSFPKMREWEAIRDQLESICRDKHLPVTQAQGGQVGLHKALLAGLLSRIGHKDPESSDYHASYNVRFAVFPGSGLNKIKLPKETKVKPGELPIARTWLIAAELVDTSRLFARRVATLDPKWIEPIAKHLCKYHRYNPFWDAEKGFVRIHEQATLFGLVIVENRLRDYSRIDPLDAREIFIRDGLIQANGLRRPPQVIAQNQKRQHHLLLAADHARQPTYALQDAFIAFYQRCLPEDVSNLPALLRHIKIAPQALLMSDEDFPIDCATQHDFPTEIAVNGLTLPLHYKHAPGAEDDGVSCTCRPSQLADLKSWHHDWLVPGLLQDKLRWLINSLPNKVRRALPPSSELLERLTSHLKPYQRPLIDALYHTIAQTFAIKIADDNWCINRLPEHLQMNFRIVNDKGHLLAQSRNLDALIKDYAVKPTIEESFSIATFDFTLKDHEILVDQAGILKVGQCLDPVQAQITHRNALIRLFQMLLGSQYSSYETLPTLPHNIKQFLKSAEITPINIGKEIAQVALAQTFIDGKAPIRSMADARTRFSACKGAHSRMNSAWRQLIVAILHQAAALEYQAQIATGILQESLDQILDQLAWLIFDGFILAIPPQALQNYPLYLEAIDIRLDRAKDNPGADIRKAAQVQPHWQHYLDLALKPKPNRIDPILLDQYRWAIETTRIQLFAPTLKAPPIATPLNKLHAALDR